MLLLVSSVKLVAEIALLALLGQWIVGLLAGARRQQNLFYQMLAIIGRPFVRAARWVSPRIVLDRHVPLVAFLLLAFVWLLATATKIQTCVRIGVALCQVARARVLLLFGRRRQALDCFDRMLAEQPGDRYALASRAYVLTQQGDPAEAIAALQDLVLAHAADAAAWFNLGFLLEAGGQLDEAEAALRRAVALQPSLDRAWYGLGLVLIRQRRFDEAVAPLRKNTELQPMSPYGWYQLARVHVDRQRPEEAAKIIRHLHRFEPKVAAQLERETGLRTAQ
jgi:tetratricopeptide (TPR) repeat protein